MKILAATLCCSLALSTGYVVTAEGTIKVVNIGDSFAVGNGFDKDGPGWYGPKWCWRHEKVWAAQAVDMVRPSAAAMGYEIDFENRGCSGMQMEHVTTTLFVQNKACDRGGYVDPDYSITNRRYAWGRGFVCDHVTQPPVKHVDDADIVILTIGGNDAGFLDIILSCFLGIGECNDAYSFTKAYLEGDLSYDECQPSRTTTCKFETDFIQMLESITSRMKPGSKIIFNAYPHLALDRDIPENGMVRDIVVASLEEQRKAIDYMNSVLTRDGAGVEIRHFAGHLDAFTGHEAGTGWVQNPDGWYNELRIEDVTLSIMLGLDEEGLPHIYHPNALGHEAWGKALSVELESVVEEIISQQNTQPGMAQTISAEPTSAKPSASPSPAPSRAPSAAPTASPSPPKTSGPHTTSGLSTLTTDGIVSSEQDLSFPFSALSEEEELPEVDEGDGESIRRRLRMRDVV